MLKLEIAHEPVHGEPLVVQSRSAAAALGGGAAVHAASPLAPASSSASTPAVPHNSAARHLLSQYTMNGYSGMSGDTNRNRVYQYFAEWWFARGKEQDRLVQDRSSTRGKALYDVRKLPTVPSSMYKHERTKSRLTDSAFDFGTGADIALTRILLKADKAQCTRVIALEGNPASAKTALEVVRQCGLEERVEVCPRLSSDPFFQERLRVGKPRVMVHEVFGFLMSLEGFVQAWREMQAHVFTTLRPTGRSLIAGSETDEEEVEEDEVGGGGGSPCRPAKQQTSPPVPLPVMGPSMAGTFGAFTHVRRRHIGDAGTLRVAKRFILVRYLPFVVGRKSRPEASSSSSHDSTVHSSSSSSSSSAPSGVGSALEGEGDDSPAAAVTSLVPYQGKGGSGAIATDLNDRAMGGAILTHTFCLEFFQFAREIKRKDLLQRRSATFAAVTDVSVNSVSFFIWAGFPEAAEHSGRPPPATGFPYGLRGLCVDDDPFQSDAAMRRGDPPPMESAAARVSYSSCNVDGDACAFNWQNLVWWLPTIRLEANDLIRISTVVNLQSETPSYELTVEVAGGSGVGALRALSGVLSAAEAEAASAAATAASAADTTAATAAGEAEASAVDAGLRASEWSGGEGGATAESSTSASLPSLPTPGVGVGVSGKERKSLASWASAPQFNRHYAVLAKGPLPPGYGTGQWVTVVSESLSGLTPSWAKPINGTRERVDKVTGGRLAGAGSAGGGGGGTTSMPVGPDRARQEYGVDFGSRPYYPPDAPPVVQEEARRDEPTQRRRRAPPSRATSANGRARGGKRRKGEAPVAPPPTQDDAPASTVLPVAASGGEAAMETTTVSMAVDDVRTESGGDVRTSESNNCDSAGNAGTCTAV